MIFIFNIIFLRMSSKDFNFWALPFVSNSSSLKALNKYLFVSINGNIWKYLNVFVWISILSGVIASSDKTLILLVNSLTPSICLHIDIWNCTILFAKISFFIESSQHPYTYRTAGFTKETTSLRYVPIVFSFDLLSIFLYWKPCFLAFLKQILNANTFFSWWYKHKTRIVILIWNLNFFSPIIKLVFL